MLLATAHAGKQMVNKMNGSRNSRRNKGARFVVLVIDGSGFEDFGVVIGVGDCCELSVQVHCVVVIFGKSGFPCHIVYWGEN